MSTGICFLAVTPPPSPALETFQEKNEKKTGKKKGKREERKREKGRKKRVTILILFPCLILPSYDRQKKSEIFLKGGGGFFWVAIIYTPATRWAGTDLSGSTIR